MLNSCCKRLQLMLGIVGDSATHLKVFQKEAIFLRSYSSKSSLVSEKDTLGEKCGSFTESYLMNSCGLSQKLAVSVSKKVQFDARERPDSVLNLLKHHGFSKTHISELVKKRPKLLLANAEKNLVPKLEFFASIGISGTGLAHMVCISPVVLERSIEGSLMPCYHIIKSLLVLDDYKLSRLFANIQWVGLAKMRSNIAPNISVLRALGVPETSISYWVSHRPFLISLESDKFKENVKKVTSMGVPPSSASFMKVLYVITRVNEPEWAQKMELYKNWGWTEDDFLLAFRKNPQFMELTEKNFSSKMDFLVNKIGWHPADVAGSSVALNYSLEKYIIPRCLVIRILWSKGLISKGEFSLGTLVRKPKQYFLDRLVIKYQEQVPELLNIFEGRLRLAELGLGFEQKVDGVKQF
ncbi:hypothetical protein ACFX2I_046399 [Malus domestica]|uniref:transcription termination factor MTERF8, chloroplastic-like n=1 Tax=Malus domestica TaxID=3750 RepID=UPI000498DBB9